MPVSQMTPAEARLVDPILTSHAIGHQEPTFTGHELFPYVEVTLHGGKIVDFEDHLTEQIETLRAPGADAAEVQVRYGKRTYALETHGLDAVVPREVHNDAMNVPSVDLASAAVNRALKPVQRNIEIAQAAMAQDANNYAASHKLALTGTNKWDKPDIDPTEDIIRAINAIELDCGGTHIVVHLGVEVMNALRTNQAISEKIKHTERSIVTEELLASLWGVAKVVCGKSLKKVNGVRQRIWGKHVVVAHVPASPVQDEPSFGYTFRLRGTPTVEMPYYRKKNRAWVYPVDSDTDTQLLMPEAGYLIQNAVA